MIKQLKDQLAKARAKVASAEASHARLTAQLEGAKIRKEMAKAQDKLAGSDSPLAALDDLQKAVDEGEFIPATTLEHLQEERIIIENIEVPLSYDSMQIGCETRIFGNLPNDKDRMLAQLDAAISGCAGKSQMGQILPLCSDSRVVDNAYIYKR